MTNQMMGEEMMTNFTDDPGNCGCYDFVIWMPGYIYDFNKACQDTAAQNGNPDPQNEYACSVDPYNGGANVHCCYAG